MSLADMLVKSGLESTKPGQLDLAGNLQKGAALALQREQLQQQKAAAQQDMLKIEATKDKQLLDTIKLANETKDPQAKKMLMTKVLPNKVRMYGREGAYPQESLDLIAQSYDAQANLLGFQLDMQDKLSKGEITVEEVRQRFDTMMQDPELLVQLDYKALYEASKTALTEEGKDRRAKMVADSAAGRQATDIAATGPKKLSSKLADDFAEYDAVGGRAVLTGNIKSLDAAIKKLESGDISTGSITTKIPGLNSEQVQSMLNQEMRNVQNDARAAIMPLLRATLGAQFTKDEGERIFGTVFDPMAGPEENARRMKRKLTELKQTLADKERAFRREGFIGGGGQAPANAEPAATPNKSGLRDQSELEDPRRVQMMKSLVAKDPNQINVLAERYGMTPGLLQRVLNSGGQ